MITIQHIAIDVANFSQQFACRLPRNARFVGMISVENVPTIISVIDPNNIIVEYNFIAAPVGAMIPLDDPELVEYIGTIGITTGPISSLALPGAKGIAVPTNITQLHVLRIIVPDNYNNGDNIKEMLR